MRGFVRFGSTAFVLVFVLSALTACDDKEVQKRIEEEIQKRMGAHSGALQSLRADVTMENYNARLKKTDVSKGKLIYMPTGKDSKTAVRLDWLSPVSESLAVVNNQFVLYRPELNQAHTGTLDKPHVSARITDALTFLNVSREKLKTDYKIKYVGTETMNGGRKTFHLKLVPKIKNEYKTMDVWADADGMPVSVKITLKNKDSIKISLSNLRKNVQVRAADFRMTLPKGVKIIKD